MESFALHRRKFLAGLGIAVATSLEPARPAVAAPSEGPKKGQRVIRTVLKDIEPREIDGAILMHEHLGLGRRPNNQPAEAAPNSPTDDPTWMEIELKAARSAGVGCIVSAQTGVPGPVVVPYLTRLSEQCGLHLINAAAYYTKQTYPASFATLTEDQIADGLVKTASEARVGALGEFGVANGESEMDPLEKKVFRAAGKAHLRTGLPIFTHNNYSTGLNVPAEMALYQLDELESVGVRPESVALGHICCHYDPKADVAKRLAKRGAFVAFDRVTRQQQWVTDEHRIAMILALLDAGHIDRLLISSDYIGRVNTNVGEVNGYPGPLHARDGGPGYARPLKIFVPLLRKAGVKDKAIRRITQENPRRFLSFVPKSG
jgi:phosphotriesterase-related protein